MAEENSTVSPLSNSDHAEPQAVQSRSGGEDWFQLSALAADDASGICPGIGAAPAPAEALAPTVRSGGLRHLKRRLKRKRLGTRLIALLIAGAILAAAGAVQRARVQSVEEKRNARAISAALTDAEVKSAVVRFAANAEPAQWAEALAAARRAKELLADWHDYEEECRRLDNLIAETWAGEQAAQEHAESAARDRAARLDLTSIRLRGLPLRRNVLDIREINHSYEAVFLKYGIDVSRLNGPEAANQIQQSALRDDLHGALCEWSQLDSPIASPEAERRRAVLQVLHQKDDDPWRKKLWDALDRGDWKALAELASALEADGQPTWVVCLVARALASHSLGGDAIQLLERAFRRTPDQFWINHELGFCLQNASPPRLDEAIACHRAALALRGDHPEAWTSLALILARKGELKEALRLHRRALEIDPSSPDSLCELGATLLHAGRYDDAAGAYQRALNVNSEFAKAWVGVGQCWLRQRRWDEALATFHQLTVREPGLPDGPYGSGLAHLGKGSPDAAVRAFQAAIAIAPKYADARNQLGTALLQLNRLHEAEAAIAGAVRLELDVAEFRADHAGVLARMGRLDDALEEYQAALRLDPDDVHAAVGIAGLRKLKDEPDKAESCLREAIRRRPGAGPLHVALGEFLLGQKRYGEAGSAFRQALYVEPGNTEARTKLQRTLLWEGKLSEALRGIHF
jgi:tetratricopeptide (TPR) repeat protein